MRTRYEAMGGYVREEMEIAQLGHKTEHESSEQRMDLREVAKMSLEELLYYVLVGDGRRLRTETM